MIIISQHPGEMQFGLYTVMLKYDSTLHSAGTNQLPMIALYEREQQ